MRAIEYCGTPNGDLPRGKSYPVAKGGIERPWADFACRFAPREIRWPRAESNHRHKDFQSSALPTELLGRAAVQIGYEAGRRGLYLRGLFQTVAESSDGDDAHAAGLELLAQPVHIHLDRVGRD